MAAGARCAAAIEPKTGDVYELGVAPDGLQREFRLEASVGACAGRDLSPVKFLSGADAVVSQGGNAKVLAIARTSSARRGRSQPEHELLVRIGRRMPQFDDERLQEVRISKANIPQFRAEP